MFTLSSFSGHLLAMAGSSDKAAGSAVRTSAEMVRDEAKRVLGTYEYGWTPLQPATVKRKSRGDTPLLETGELRDSIVTSVGQNRVSSGQFSAGFSAMVYSTSPKAVWHELGTRTVPPRPFLLPAALRLERDVVALVGKSIFNSLIAKV